MAKVTRIGPPENESECQAIRFLRDHLPDDWRIFHNFEMCQDKDVFEIDIAILARHAVFLVDVKGTGGSIDVYNNQWYPEGRASFHSPLHKLRKHARTMAAIIRASNTKLKKAHVQATVLLTADDAAVHEEEGINCPERLHVINLKDCKDYFLNASRISVPKYRMDNITHLHDQIAEVIIGNSKEKSPMRVFRDWQAKEKLDDTDRYTEYRAERLDKSGGIACLRIYGFDSYQEETVRQKEFKKISNAYNTVVHMPAHPNVLAVRELFASEDEDKMVVVTEDLPGPALRLHINKASLTFDRKLQVMRDVLEALEHAHEHDVIHCNLTPDTILVTKDGRARVTGFDFARVGKNRTSTSADPVVDDLEAAYLAPECIKDLAHANRASDLYAAGLIFYELLTGEQSFESDDQKMEADSRFLIKPSEHKPDLPEGIDEWLQKFCESEPKKRHTRAAIARKDLDALIQPRAKNEAAPDVRSPIVAQPQLPDNLMNLPQHFSLANRFRIQKKLGGGGFEATYKVFDPMGDVVRVIKLVTTARRSVYERLRREYTALIELPDHPHVMKAIWADRMVNAKQASYMYIVFEYVEGQAVSDRIEAGELSLNDAVRIVRETADGLAHLHKHSVYHQDVKPSNLLWTDKGVRLIDFNVVVSESDEVQGSGDTRRYLPPDYDYSSAMAASDQIDRDLYALGISFYECLTGHYPFDASTPPIKTQPKDPKQFKGCTDLSPSLVNVLMKMIAPERKDRFAVAGEFLIAMDEVKHLRLVLTTGEIGAEPKVTPNGKTTFIQHLPLETTTNHTFDLSQTILTEDTAATEDTPVATDNVIEDRVGETEAVGTQETSLKPGPPGMSLPMSEPDPLVQEAGFGLGLTILVLLALGTVMLLILFVVRPPRWEDTLAMFQELPGESAPVVVTDILFPTTELLPTATVAVVPTATPESPIVGLDDETETSPPVRTVAEVQLAVPYLLSTVRMRAGPGEEFVDKGELEAGAEVTLIGVNGDATWFMLANRYWIPVEAVSQVPDGLSVRVPSYALVNANVRVRSTADAPRIGGVQANETLVLIGRQEGTNPAGIWYQLDTGGWIFGDLVVDAQADLPEVE